MLSFQIYKDKQGYGFTIQNAFENATFGLSNESMDILISELTEIRNEAIEGQETLTREILLDVEEED